MAKLKFSLDRAPSATSDFQELAAQGDEVRQQGIKTHRSFLLLLDPYWTNRELSPCPCASSIDRYENHIKKIRSYVPFLMTNQHGGLYLIIVM